MDMNNVMHGVVSMDYIYIYIYMHGYEALLAFLAHFSKNQGWLVQGGEPPRNRTLYNLLRLTQKRQRSISHLL